jgi:hypothetical protein
MKKLLVSVLLSLGFSNSIYAGVITHCPQVGDVHLLSWHGVFGSTYYDGVKALFMGSERDAETPLAYFKEVELQESSNNNYVAHCTYVHSSGKTIKLLAYSPSTKISGSKSGPWARHSCNSPNPADCMFVMSMS